MSNSIDDLSAALDALADRVMAYLYANGGRG